MNPGAEQIKLASLPYVEALTAMCIVGRDGDYHVQNPEWIYSKRSFMRNMFAHWGVGSSDELKQNIEWSLATGQRKEFDDMTLLLSSLSEQDRMRYLESQKGDTAQSFKMSIVNSYLGRMPAGGIAANDYTWAVFKCCAGHKMDYLTEDEKWTYIGDIIQLVKSQYSNWKDYLISFTVGGAFNSTLQSSDYISENRAIITKLLVSDYSPLRQAILK
ncbi:DUF1266 domain-containing protein [Paenibacillus sp. 32352]|uniref:DUF1266 domain-containing protein n=1 Tax=Paenibacillus sp. 32352 TaxID=1969111 RepID=UPI0015C44BAD|nr:DUF1266 domain-containing protein [Paenibacillus sp. 32352]